MEEDFYWNFYKNYINYLILYNNAHLHILFLKYIVFMSDECDDFFFLVFTIVSSSHSSVDCYNNK